MCVKFHIVLPLFSFLIVYLAFSVLSHICGCLSHHPFVILSVSLLSPFLFITPSVYSPIFVLHTPTNMHTCAHTDTHTPLFLLAFFSVISSNTTLSSCLITKQGHYICLHELPSLCGCVCRCVWGIRSLTLAHTDTHKHLSMPPGPCAQLSVSLILFPLISTHPPHPHILFFVFLSYISPISNHSRLLLSLSLFWGVISSFIINDVYFLPVQVWWIFENDMISSYGDVSIQKHLKIVHVLCLADVGNINSLSIGHTLMFGCCSFDIMNFLVLR